jgi:hypothetical protein
VADGSGGGGAGMGVIVGGLVVVVAVIGFMMFSGGNFGSTRNVNVNLHAPSLPAAAPK